MSRLRVSFLCLSILCHAGCGTDAAMPGTDAGAMPAAPAAVGWAALHYAVDFDLASRTAHTQVTLRIDGPGNCVTIGFHPAAVMDVSFDGTAAEAANTALDATAGTLTACRAGLVPWATGQMVVLATTAVVPETTIAKSQVGYSTKKDLNGHPFNYLLSWVDGCDHHGPCDARPNRFATYRFTVTHPAGTQVLCPGTITAGATQTICDFTLDGGPTYSTFGLMAGQSWAQSSLGAWGGVDVTLYDYPATKIAASFDKAKGKQHFEWLQSLLGAYPYGKELRFVVAPTYWQGFEHPGNIAISESLATAQSSYTDGLRHVTMHEVTHQWAGDQATLADTYDFFWKESMAEYLTFVFEDEQIAHDDALATAATWKGWAQASQHYPVPGDKPTLFNYYSDAYGEGPLILFRQLETMYSRQAVLDALKALVGTGKPRALSVDDVRKALEATTGAQLTNYFNGWVHGMGKPVWPTAKVTATDAGAGMVKVTVDVSTSDSVARGCAFKVRLDGANGEHFDVPVNLGPDGAPFAPVTVKPGFAVAATELDPLSECIIFDAPGHIAPRALPPVDPWRARDY